MSSEEGEMLPPAATPPLDDDNLLSEILLRLPPQPSSLPRASAVCKRWLALVSDRGFVCRFRLHHRHRPPLLGFFCWHAGTGSMHFKPTMEPPNRLPPGHFSLPIKDVGMRCRHGLVVFPDSSEDQHLVWDPVTGDQHPIATPPGFVMYDCTVLRAAGDDHHFLVVCLQYAEEETPPRAIVFIYSSETRLWSNPISTPVPIEALDYEYTPAALVGNSLYWPSSRVILEVDLCRQSIAMIPVPMDIARDFTVIRAEGGGVGLLSSLSAYTVQLWKRNTDCDGVDSWVPGSTIELDWLLSLDPPKQARHMLMIAYAEENNVAFLYTFAGIYMVQLETLEFSKFAEDGFYYFGYPLETVYATGIGGGHGGADQDMLV